MIHIWSISKIYDLYINQMLNASSCFGVSYGRVAMDEAVGHHFLVIHEFYFIDLLKLMLLMQLLRSRIEQRLAARPSFCFLRGVSM